MGGVINDINWGDGRTNVQTLAVASSRWGVWEAWFDGAFAGHLGLYCGDFLVVTILLCV